MAPAQQKQVASPYLYLDIHDEVIQGLIHFTRQPEVGHSVEDTFELWNHILHLAFPREQGYGIRAYHESPPKTTKSSPKDVKPIIEEKMLMDFSDDTDTDTDDDDNSGGIIIEIWSLDGYYDPQTNQWIGTTNSLIFILLCHASTHDILEFPAVRNYGSKTEKKPSTLISISTPLQLRLQTHCQRLINSTPSKAGLSVGIACGSGIRFFKWKVVEPELLNGYVYWHIDLGSGNPGASAKAVEGFIEGTKEMTRRGKF